MTYIQAQGGCQMCLSAVKLDHSGELFWDTHTHWVSGYLYFEPGAWIWTKRFRRYFHIVKSWSGNFSLNSTRVRALGWPLIGFFSIFWFFFFFWGGSLRQIIYREYTVFRGSNISCSLACLRRDRLVGSVGFGPVERPLLRDLSRFSRFLCPLYVQRSSLTGHRSSRCRCSVGRHTTHDTSGLSLCKVIPNVLTIGRYVPPSTFEQYPRERSFVSTH